MSLDSPDETWEGVHPLALRFVSTPRALLVMVVGIVVVWLVVSWWTDWRWSCWSWWRRWKRAR